MSGKDPEEEPKSIKKVELDTSLTYYDQEKGILGCKHYMRGCKKLAACCDQLFTCRWCHDETISDHKIDRHKTEQMMCMYCKTVQKMAQVCSNTNCGKTLANYYCDICKFHDDAPNKSIYHCMHCGICRVGKGLDIDFFHCLKCCACLAIGTKENHKCIENNLKSNCAICNQDLFSSRQSTTILKCGHPIHLKCLTAYEEEGNFSCPLCSKSIGDLSSTWHHWDQIIQSQPMPPEWNNARAVILCNDCEKKAEVPFHFVGLKCQPCGGYNTRILTTSGFPQRDPDALTINQSNENE